MIHRTPFGKFSKWVLIFLNAFSPLRSNLESQESFLWGFRFCNYDSFSPQVLSEHGSNTLQWSYGKWSYGKFGSSPKSWNLENRSNERMKKIWTRIISGTVWSPRYSMHWSRNKFWRENGLYSCTLFWLKINVCNYFIAIDEIFQYSNSISEEKKRKICEFCARVLSGWQISTRCRVCLSQILSLWRARDA